MESFCLLMAFSVFRAFTFSPFQDPVNANMIDRIQRSLFCVCLDELPQNHTDLARSEKSRIRQGLSGEGPYVNGCNRWYDKALQVRATC